MICIRVEQACFVLGLAMHRHMQSSQALLITHIHTGGMQGKAVSLQKSKAQKLHSGRACSDCKGHSAALNACDHAVHCSFSCSPPHPRTDDSRTNSCISIRTTQIMVMSVCLPYRSKHKAHAWHNHLWSNKVPGIKYKPMHAARCKYSDDASTCLGGHSSSLTRASKKRTSLERAS